MKIDSVTFYYLSMPIIRDIGDGSQDALLVRVQAGGHTGWGECEASPLVSIANLVCPMSHSACRSIQDAVMGQRIDEPADIPRINNHAREIGLDIAQTGHTLSGVDIALWDLLGKRLCRPVYELLGYAAAYPKQPYASQLFGDTPHDTLQKAAAMRQKGYRAVKFGWGPFGHGTLNADRDQLAAAREGLGPDGRLLVDAGTAWGEDVAQAAQRLDALRKFGAGWLEEPFVGTAVHAYHELSRQAKGVPLAGGEGAHHPHLACHLIDHGGIGVVQIDTGRIGGITPAWQIAQYAQACGVQYVNHTFTTHLALSASLQPFAGQKNNDLCEYPVESSDLAQSLTRRRIEPDKDGLIHVPAEPGLGMEPNPQTIRRYLVETEIRVGGRLLYQTPNLDDLE